ncbi:MAG: hypothetical protein FJZ13_06275, partial [Candidatus Omnitrophica bacterium]|nr:hypothetical protein [Candidatus Omnitrophota bacterium]
MVNNEYLINTLGFVSMVIIISLATVIAWKMQRLRQLQSVIDKLRKSLDEMDEQAKLIVRTDMELNKTQEELDKKVTSLYALQGLSRAISTTLEEGQIFKRIDAGYLEDIGFEKAFAFLWNERGKKFLPCLNIGFEEEALESAVNLGQESYINLIANEKTLSSISMDKLSRDKTNQSYKINSFVIAPILPKEGDKGFLFVATENADTLITEGDEELLTILANQLGQALENARLFEKTWRAQQGLEDRVKERTHELTLALEEVKKVSKRKT